ncbi:hypothetical protein E3E36_04170 [Thermococcus sp. M36]|uniref:hypothetical protein n=1 Tax=Thermococcus sp. M36 TaxID=1638261 RepID=UPI001439B44C|nr:hypothetical protein [Thermococcus sp. M36]NJE05348.1 hypothetical protein [Thermococcus sp. M36]
MAWKRFLSLILVVFIAGFLINPVAAVTSSTDPELPDSIEENKVVDFSLTITDIRGSCVLIETDLEKDGGTPIFDVTDLTGYTLGSDGKSLKICNNLPSKLVIPIHGRIPEGITRKTVLLPTGESLYLKFFDQGQKSYYRVKDLSGNTVIDTTSKSFTIIHPQLEDIMRIIDTNITDPNARGVAKKYISLGLIDYVYGDLIPIFVKYDPGRVANLEQRVSKLQSLTDELNSTIKDQSATLSSLEAENSRLKSQTSDLESKVSELQNENSDLKGQIEALTQERDEYRKSAGTFKTVSILLFVVLLAGSFFAYRTGRQSGYKEGYRKGYDEGKREGYNRGKRDGYEQCMEEMGRSEPSIGSGVL